MVRPQARVGILFLCSLVLLSGLLLRSFWLQGIQGPAFASEAAYQQEDTVPVPGMRGTFFDRNGRDLAGSEPGVSVFATPYQMREPAAQADALSGALEADRDSVYEAITAPGGFSYVERGRGRSHRPRTESGRRPEGH
jgi:cell division protein FtsI/penicillin-binding protein 2